MLQLPESLQFYFESEQQSSAIDQIIESESVPFGLKWDEVEQYNLAKVSARTTQLDYWRLMNEVWNRTWGKALAGSKYKEVDSSYYEDDYSMESVWEESFYKVFEDQEKTLTFYCYCPENSNLQLGFCVESASGNYQASDNLSLSDGWAHAAGDARSTAEGIVELRSRTEIDIEPLTSLATEAVLKLKERV